MLRPFLVLTALAVPPVAATGTTPATEAASPAATAPAATATAAAAQAESWGLAAMPNGCMVQAVSPGGTMLSIWGFGGQEKIAFLLQNRDWRDLREGGRHDIKVDFVGMRAWPVEATVREKIDADGPGFFFTIEPGRAGGTGFLDAFARAEGMRIVQDGRDVDTLPLAGSRGAMAALARCLAEKWGGAPEAPEAAAEPAGVAI
ncbi:MAG: hypothetical protein ACK40O_03085 [Allosphingosinicella sp.]